MLFFFSRSYLERSKEDMKQEIWEVTELCDLSSVNSLFGGSLILSSLKGRNGSKSNGIRLRVHFCS